MVVDANGATVSRLPGTTGQEDLGVHDLKIHVLLRGEVFDLKTRTVVVSAAVESGDRDSVR